MHALNVSDVLIRLIALLKTNYPDNFCVLRDSMHHITLSQNIKGV